MAIWSRLFGALRAPNITKNVSNINRVNVRSLSLSKVVRSDDHREFNITPSRWQWDKFKDMVHYYFMVGMIPVVIIVFGSNVFIGPAELTPIPEGYTPKYWEYASHPITRFIYRYLQHSPQMDYEKMCHYLYEEKEKILLRELEAKIKNKMAENADYQAYYYRPVTAKYLRAYKKAADDMHARMGFND